MNDYIRNQSAKKIQTFWRLSKLKRELFGKYNYDFYLKILESSQESDEFKKLSSLMYSRVISTPKSAYPLLQQKNPYVGWNASYHRSDSPRGELQKAILSQWGISDSEIARYEYIPVISSANGDIGRGLKAIGISPWSYDIISPPTNTLPMAKYLKFIKTSQSDLRWSLSHLGLIASPWLLACVATECMTTKLPMKQNEFLTDSIKQLLQKQPRTISELKKHPAFVKLDRLRKEVNEVTLLAQALYSLINNLPNIEAPDICSRLSLFLEMTMAMHNKDYTLFAGFMYTLVHEISLLLILHNKEKNIPYITYYEYCKLAFEDMQDILNLPKQENQSILAFPANAGLHANFIASQLAVQICQEGGQCTPTVRQDGGEYYEVIENHTYRNSYTWLGQPTKGENAHIVRVSAGTIGDYHAGIFPAIDLNKLIRNEIKKNQQIKVIQADITSASYQQLKLDSDVIDLLKKKNISLLLWESPQKFGLLHTDQAQYGRVMCLYNGSLPLPSAIKKMEENANADMGIPDVQISAYIHKNCKTIFPAIRSKHFLNGKTLNNNLSFIPQGERINMLEKEDLRVSEPCNPFVFLNNKEEGEVERFFWGIEQVRASFGHALTTIESSRIAAGCENKVNVEILGKSISHFLNDMRNVEVLDRSMLGACKYLDITKQQNVIHFFSIFKAFQLRSSRITSELISSLRFILDHSEAISKLLNGDKQFITDIYSFFSKSSPFREISLPQNNLLAQVINNLNDSYCKTGRINLTNAIKKGLYALDSPYINKKITLEEVTEIRINLYLYLQQSSKGLFIIDLLKKCSLEESEQICADILRAVANYWKQNTTKLGLMLTPLLGDKALNEMISELEKTAHLLKKSHTKKEKELAFFALKQSISFFESTQEEPEENLRFNKEEKQKIKDALSLAQ